MRVLIVEDDPELAAAVVSAFQLAAYAVDHAASGAQADELATVYEYDLVVLDWSIPPPSGLELLRAWRARGLAVPVLMLTGRGSLDDRVSGLDTGADDYLTKPFAVAELMARARSLLRRRQRPIDLLEADDLTMDRAARGVTVGGEPVRLTAKEFAVLEHLLAHRDRAVSRQELAEHAWDRSFDPMSNTIDVIVHRVRKKIDGGRQERLLHTVPGVGWLLSSARRRDDAAGG